MVAVSFGSRIKINSGREIHLLIAVWVSKGQPVSMQAESRKFAAAALNIANDRVADISAVDP